MKKKIFMAVNLFISIISFVLANNFYSKSETALGIVFSIIGILFISLYSVVLGLSLFKKLNEKNDLLIGGISLAIYVVTYVIYMSAFNIFPNLDYNVYSILLVIFYVSFLTLILCLTIVFYFWNSKNKKKNILYFVVITITILLSLILGSKLFNNLPKIVSNSVGFLYFTGVILLLLYVIVLILFKIVKPLKK